MAVALIVAAGRGERLGAGARRRSSSWRPADGAVEHGRPRRCRGSSGSSWPSARGLQAPGGRDRRCVGGAVRSESVRRALGRGRGPGRGLVVHDAARPLRHAGARRRACSRRSTRRPRLPTRRSRRRRSTDTIKRRRGERRASCRDARPRAACGRCRPRRCSAAPRSSGRLTCPPRCSPQRPTTPG